MDFDPNSRYLAPSEMIFLLALAFICLFGFVWTLVHNPWTLWLVLGMFVVYGFYGGTKVARRVYAWVKKDWNEK